MQKILVVDDDPNIVKLLLSRLLANGYSVETASDGQAGLEKAKSWKPDLIVLDVIMPRMDGYSFVLQVRKENLFPNTPIIVLTAKDKMRDLFEMEGIRYYMVKPFKAEELLQVISEALSRK